MTAILDRRLILVVGKGGVGRSTVAAAIAAATAARGRRTLLYEANAKDRFGEFFGHEPIGTSITKLRDKLFAVNTTPAAALEEYGLMILRFRKVYKLVFENRITEAFIKAIPGVDDYALLGKAWFHTKEHKGNEPRWDTLVFDMAASGHSLAMLRIPWAITATVPDGPLTRDAKEIQKLLLDQDRTAVIMVTMAEDMPSNEAIELRDQLGEYLQLPISQVVVNQLYEDRFPESSPQAQVLAALEQSGAEAADLAPLTGHALQFRSRRQLNENYLSRLKKAFRSPLVHLPRIFASRLTTENIDEFAKSLGQALGAADK